MQTQYDVIVIGGGPAGMMAAIQAASHGVTTLLIERNMQLGCKLLITGNGRCNLTNNCSLEPFIKHLGANGPFLRDAFKSLFNKELCEFFESRNVPLKTERQQRMFPTSDKSQSIVDALIKELKVVGVRVSTQTRVKNICDYNSQTELFCSGDKRFLCHSLILASGGLSSPSTGSDGSLIPLIKDANHRIVKPHPALVPLTVEGKAPAFLEGLSLKNIRLKFKYKNKVIKTVIGEMIFTHNGISGPLVLTYSGDIVEWLSKTKVVHCTIDLKPALTEETIQRRLTYDIQHTPKRAIKNLLKKYVPVRMIEWILEMTHIDPNKKVQDLSKADRVQLIEQFKRFALDVNGSEGFRQAMISRGGVSIRDVDPRTMQSRRHPGWFFAGEILDVDGDTGGFNLQAAFSTGFVAGTSAALQSQD